MLRFEKSYFAPNTFDSKADSQDEYECVEMDSRLPLFAASVQLEDGSIRWLLVAGPGVLALGPVNANLTNLSATEKLQGCNSPVNNSN